MKFSTYLFETNQLKSAEDIESAIRSFDNLEQAKQPSEARNILKAADRVGYVVKAEKILKYSNKKDVDVSKERKSNNIKDNVPKEVTDKNIISEPLKAIDLKQSQLYKKYGHLNLDRYPATDIEDVDVQEFPENVGKGPILRWKNPKNGQWLRAYDKTFLDKNAEYKWERIKNITPEHINTIDTKSKELLKSENENDKDAGAIIQIILKTGLRPGDKSLKTGTDNRGISSLKPSSVTIEGDAVKLDFIGKSTKQNLSEFEDAEIAKYLQQKIKKNADSEFLFDISKDQLERYFHKISPLDGMKIKDLRTYKATSMAKDILADNDIPPLPVPDKPSEIKKAVESKLDIVFERVSTQLNNTPQMSKVSYILPDVINKWFEDIGVKVVDISNKKYEKVVTEEDENNVENDNSTFEENADDCDYYSLPDWWDNSNMILINTNKYSEEE